MKGEGSEGRTEKKKRMAACGLEPTEERMEGRKRTEVNERGKVKTQEKKNKKKETQK